jgi:dephospho-CoA kinase
MIVLGLTGSIGMGKSTAALCLRRLGVPVHDADAAVHRLQAKGGAAVAPIAATFPGVVKEGKVDRQALGRIVFSDEAALKKLEAILHPLVRREEQKFLANARAHRYRLVALDIPLLFETHGERRCDYVMVVSAPRRVQLGRVMRRPGMTRERLAGIEARQLPDIVKRARADIVIDTGLGRRHSLQAIRRAVTLLRRRDRRHGCVEQTCGD